MFFDKLLGAKNTAYKTITPTLAAAKIKEGKVLVLDVREVYEYKQGHIKGSRLIPLSKFGVDSTTLGSPQTEIIVVCRSGHRSSLAAGQLAKRGYENLWSLEGGMIAWQRAGLPVER